MYNNSDLQTNTKRYHHKSANDDSSEDDSVTVSYKSNRTPMPAGPSDQGATAVLETETEKDKDAQALFEKAQKINEVIFKFNWIIDSIIIVNIL